MEEGGHSQQLFVPAAPVKVLQQKENEASRQGQLILLYLALCDEGSYRARQPTNLQSPRQSCASGQLSTLVPSTFPFTTTLSQWKPLQASLSVHIEKVISEKDSYMVEEEKLSLDRSSCYYQTFYHFNTTFIILESGSLEHPINCFSAGSDHNFVRLFFLKFC